MSSASDALLLETLQARALRCPFNRWLAVRFVEIRDGQITVRLPWREDFIGRPDPAMPHGGVLASLIDIAASNAVALSIGHAVPTINLRIDYLRVARAGDLFAIARSTRAGRTVAHVDVEVKDSHEHLIALGRGIFFAGKQRPAGAAPSP